jgi:hypothetical protein
MMKYLASTVHFQDTLASLQNEFRDDRSNDLIICGAHDFSKYNELAVLRRQYSKIIVFNQEPLTATQRQFMHPRYESWIKEADEVWDYDEKNIEYLQKIRSDVKLHVLKPFKDWSKYQVPEKDIDILFYGAMNEHRATVLSELRNHYNVVVIGDVYGDALDEFILRSKLLLNIHYFYECAMQEQARMIRWIGAPCRIISEKSWKNYLNVEELTYEELLKL